jgi:hypothetical protein
VSSFEWCHERIRDQLDFGHSETQKLQDRDPQ